MRTATRVTLGFAAALVVTAVWGRAEDTPVMFRGDAAHSGRSPLPAAIVRGLSWRFKTGGKVRSTPAVARGVAVFGSEDGSLYAVALNTGKEVWKVRIGGDVSGSPAIAGDRVLILGADNVLRCLALADGHALWALATGTDAPISGDPRVYDMFVSSPTIADGKVFVGGGDGKVYSVDLATGALRWSHPTRHRVRSTPAVADGRVFVGSCDGSVYCLDETTGAERWTYETGDIVQSSPAVAGGMVVVGTRASAVLGFDEETGKRVWRRPHPGSWVLASPAVAGGKVVVGGSDSHRLEALDLKTGAPIWSVDTGARTLASPTIAGNVVLYAAEDFRVHAADLDTGLGLAMEFTEAAIYSSPVLAEGLVLAGSDDDHMYAFHTEPVFPTRGAAAPEILEAAVGRYALDSGGEFAVSLRQGRLGLEYGHFPPGLVVVNADGTFSCPYLFGLRGRIERQPGSRASALVLTEAGKESRARRVE